MSTGMTVDPIWVVAGALKVSEDTWLMHRRPLEKAHGGLWEFPGGKVEHTEIPVKALVRELREELGICVRESDCIPAIFAEDYTAKNSDLSVKPIVILLYIVTDWTGEPHALEWDGQGEGIGRFTADSIRELPKPPLDDELARRLFEKV